MEKDPLISLSTLTTTSMSKTNDLIIADTSGVVSLAVDTDHNHSRAMEEATLLSTEQRTILVPTNVLVETLNVLGKKSGHDTALRVLHELLLPGGQFLLTDSTPFHQAASAKFKAQPAAVSFTDCIVMAVADGYNTLDIFGFDKQFADAGYHRLGPSTEGKEAA